MLSAFKKPFEIMHTLLSAMNETWVPVSSLLVVVAPDIISETLAHNYLKEPDGKERTKSKLPVLNLPPSKNVFQVSKFGTDTYTSGEQRDSCYRPWLYGEGATRKLFTTEGVAGKSMTDNLCRRVRDLLMQNISAEGTCRYMGQDYSEMRTIAIEQLDAEPCGDRNLDHSEGYSFNTQMCFRCIHSDEHWQCSLPQGSRRNGIIVAAGATWLDTRTNCPKRARQKKMRYSESDFVRLLLYTQGERIQSYLDSAYGVKSESIDTITLCGEGISPWGGEKEDDVNGNQKEAGGNTDTSAYVVANGIRNIGDTCDETLPQQNCALNKGLRCQGPKYSGDSVCVADHKGERKNPNPFGKDAKKDEENFKNVGPTLWTETIDVGAVCYDDINCKRADTDESSKAYCIKNVCVQVGSTFVKPKPNVHGACRTKSDCPKNPSSKTGHEHGTCVKEKHHHIFSDIHKEEKVSIGICLSSPQTMVHGSVCIEGEDECGKNGRCDGTNNKYGTHSGTHRCVMDKSIESCDPCLQSGVKVRKTFQCQFPFFSYNSF